MSCDPGGPASRRRGRLPRHRRHDVAEEGDAFGRGRAAIRVGLGQDGQLPNVRVADAGARRGPCDGGLAAVLPEDLDRRRSSARARWGARRISLGADEVGDRARRTRSPDRRGRSLRGGPRRRRVRHGRRVPSGFERTRACLGCRHSRHQRSTRAKSNSSSPSPHAAARANACAQCPLRRRRRHARPSEMAHARPAQGNEGTPKGPLRRRPRARRRRAAAATDRRQGHAAHAGQRSLVSPLPANLPADTDLKTLAATIKARWVCEQAHHSQEELGLDHFEGRSWRGLNRHALMAMIAYAFLQHRRLAAASGGKKNCPRAASADAAGHTKSHRRSPGARSTLPMPTLPPANPQIARI